MRNLTGILALPLFLAFLPSTLPGDSILLDYTFDADSEGWLAVGVPTIYTEPVFAAIDGRLSLRSTNNTNTFGWWTSPSSTPSLGSSLLRIDAAVYGTAERKADSPVFRIRLNSTSFQAADLITIRSLGEGTHSVSAAEPKLYSLYTAPEYAAPGVRTSFDLFNGEREGLPAAGVELDTLRLSAAFDPTDLTGQSAIFSMDSAGFGAWIFQSDFQELELNWNTTASDAVGSISNGRLRIFLPTNNGSVGYWKYASAYPLQAGKLYRATFSVTTDVSDRTTAPTFSMSVSADGGSIVWSKSINSVGDASLSPSGEVLRDYDVWFAPPPELAGKSLTFLFQGLNFDTSDAAESSVYLGALRLTSYDRPQENLPAVVTPTPTPIPTITPSPTPTPLPSARTRDKLIIVAGGGEYTGNAIARQTRSLAEATHYVATNRGYDAGRDIMYLSAFPTLPGINGPITNPNVDGPATLDALEQAILGWGADARRLIIVLLDHGERGTGNEVYFLLDGTRRPRELLSGARMDEILDIAQSGADPLDQAILYVDMCYAGGFINACALPFDSERRRAVLASTSAERLASYGGPTGQLSFTGFFVAAAHQGNSLFDSYVAAREAMTALRVPASAPQFPMLDDDGNGLYTIADGAWLRGHVLGRQQAFGNIPPAFTSVKPDSTLDAPEALELWVELDLGTVDEVTAYVALGDGDYLPGEPITGYQDIALRREGVTQRWSATLPADAIRYRGAYTIVYTAGKADPTAPDLHLQAAPISRKITVLSGPEPPPPTPSPTPPPSLEATLQALLTSNGALNLDSNNDQILDAADVVGYLE